MAGNSVRYGCDVCLGRFDTTAVPLVLPCGHTFCRPCLTIMHQNDMAEHGLGCPSCRQRHHLADLALLPTNYILLQMESDDAHQQGGCEQHQGDRIRYWCSSCDEPGCGTCMYHSHIQGHHLVLDIAQGVAECKKRLQKRCLKLQQDTSLNWDAINQKIQVSLVAGYFHCVLFGRVLTLESKIKAAQNMNQLEQCRHMMDGLEDEEERASREQQYVEQLDTGSNINSEGQLRFGPWIVKGDEHALLLQPLSNSPYCPLQLSQCALLDNLVGMDLEVFLELSVGQEVLGLVVIRLWSGLRLSQQFLTLCLGTLGPTYHKSRLIAVRSQNTSREMVVAGTYKTKDDNSFHSEPLVRGLEWGGQWSALYREGLVVAAAADRTTFGICTSPLAMEIVQGPFGEVVRGLEVVRRCMTRKPIYEVTISGCGVVVQPADLCGSR